MFTKFEIRNLRDSGKALSLPLMSDFTISTLGRLKGKTTLGKALVNGVGSSVLDALIADKNKSRSDSDMLLDEGVTLSYQGKVNTASFLYEITIIDTHKVRDERLVVNDQVVFSKTPDNLDAFELSLEGAETLRTNLGGNRTIKLINYVHNNSLFDKASDKGQVLAFLYKSFSNMIYASTDVVQVGGYEKPLLDYLTTLVDPKRYADLSAAVVNEKLKYLFESSGLKDYLHFEVSLIDDFDGRTIKVHHDGDSYSMKAGGPKLFQYLTLIALLAVHESECSLIYFDDLLPETVVISDIPKSVIDIFEGKTQVVMT